MIQSNVYGAGARLGMRRIGLDYQRKDLELQEEKNQKSGLFLGKKEVKYSKALFPRYSVQEREARRDNSKQSA